MMSQRRRLDLALDDVEDEDVYKWEFSDLFEYECASERRFSQEHCRRHQVWRGCIGSEQSVQYVYIVVASSLVFEWTSRL